MRSYFARFMRTKRALLVPFAALALALGAFAAMPRHSSAQPQGKAEFMIENQSDWAIHHLYLSSTDEQEWGPDQLGNKVLEPGGSYTLHSIPCDKYDIKVVDHDGDACVIEGITMCKDHTHWNLTNKDLLSCEGFGQ
ncbi:MAG: hypothetical protein WCF57_24490 [Pyrinomonadaceae bacterium]